MLQNKVTESQLQLTLTSNIYPTMLLSDFLAVLLLLFPCTTNLVVLYHCDHLKYAFLYMNKSNIILAIFFFFFVRTI